MDGGWREKHGRRKARKKGLNFEREVAQEIRHIFPEVKRHLEFQKSEAKGVDLDNTGRFKIQCKKYAGYVSVATIGEIEHDRLVGDVPVLVTAGTDLEPMAVLPFSSLVELIEKVTKV